MSTAVFSTESKAVLRRLSGMKEVSGSFADNILTIKLSGHVDSVNAADVENEITALREENPAQSVILDCDALEYISSAGLRVILRLKRSAAELKLVNVQPEVYDVLEMTGFTEMMEVRKAYRVLSVDGCDIIGQGANGRVYRIDPDTIVKVYYSPDSLEEIQRERELARTAFVLGVPTAIPYDVVRIEGGGYGSVYELLNADSFAELLIKGEKTVDEVAAMSISLLKIIHGTLVKPGIMPDMRRTALHWADYLQDHLPEEQYKKLHDLIAAVPQDMHMMHGDYHIKNIMLQNGESLLIDMDTLCCGYPIFELASMFNAYCGFSELDNSVSRAFLGIPHETAVELWYKSLKLYLDGADDEKVREVEEKAQIIGYTRIMRRGIRRGGLETEEGRAEIENCRKHLKDLLSKVDTLLF